MALTLAECDAITPAVERYKVHLVVAHPAFDRTSLMRDIIGARAGKLGLINTSTTPISFIGRAARELDTSKARHPVQQVRTRSNCALLAASRQAAARRACSIRRGRPKEAALRSCIRMARGLAGLQRLRPFRFRRMHFGIGERGAPKPIAMARPAVRWRKRG